MSKIEVNAIEPQCGTTLTIGASDTSIAGIGTVNWDTTAKTTAFTAVSGRGYFVDTNSAAITVTLPATPSSGNIVSVSDYNGTASTNAITIARNGSNINGSAEDFDITKANSAITFVYVDGTVGWTSVQTSNTTDTQNPFIIASGGTETFCGDYKIHTFTGPGTFSVSSLASIPSNNVVDYLVVAGGGGGGGAYGGGGGAGGYRESSGTASGCYTVSPLGACVSALPISATTYPITVGGGGDKGPLSPSNPGTNGSNSVFSTITSTGGGAGGGDAPPTAAGGDGGSGGGGGNGKVAGSGNTPPVSPPQGNDGGGTPGTATGGNGGGGATASGEPAIAAPGPNYSGGDGGAGATSSINGTPTARGGGGGGGLRNPGGTAAGSGGIGGGGAGSGGPVPATAGTTNTGGGGGGASGNFSPTGCGANGGSGIVIIRYKYQ